MYLEILHIYEPYPSSLTEPSNLNCSRQFLRINPAQIDMVSKFLEILNSMWPAKDGTAPLIVLELFHL